MDKITNLMFTDGRPWQILLGAVKNEHFLLTQHTAEFNISYLPSEI